MIQAYCVKNIKRYDQIKNNLKSVKAQLVRPVSGLSERDRVFDQDFLWQWSFQGEKLKKER